MTYEEKFEDDFEKWAVETGKLYPPSMDDNQLKLQNFERRFRKTHNPPKK